MGSVKDTLLDETAEEPVELIQNETESTALTAPKMSPQAVTMWNDVATFEPTQRMAKLL